LNGVDLARGPAILGMFAAHAGPEPSVGGPLGWVMQVARGRSAALFALPAGLLAPAWTWVFRGGCWSTSCTPPSRQSN
jgi:hypothetical protein